MVDDDQAAGVLRRELRRVAPGRGHPLRRGVPGLHAPAGSSTSRAVRRTSRSGFAARVSRDARSSGSKVRRAMLALGVQRVAREGLDAADRRSRTACCPTPTSPSSARSTRWCARTRCTTSTTRRVLWDAMRAAAAPGALRVRPGPHATRVRPPRPRRSSTSTPPDEPEVLRRDFYNSLLRRVHPGRDPRTSSPPPASPASTVEPVDRPPPHGRHGRAP